MQIPVSAAQKVLLNNVKECKRSGFIYQLAVCPDYD